MPPDNVRQDGPGVPCSMKKGIMGEVGCVVLGEAEVGLGLQAKALGLNPSSRLLVVSLGR